MTRNEIIESAHACMNHAGHCDKCERDNRACWGGMSKTEAAEWMIGEHRLTLEEQRYIELGKAVEALFRHGCSISTQFGGEFESPDELLAWHRAEVEKE